MTNLKDFENVSEYLKTKHYELTTDTDKNIQAAQMMSKLLGVPVYSEFGNMPHLCKHVRISRPYTMILNSIDKNNTTEISYLELEGLYKEQYWFDASVEDAKYEEGKNAEKSERK